MGQVAYFRFLIRVFRFSFLLRAGVLHESGYLPILASKGVFPSLHVFSINKVPVSDACHGDPPPC